ncbi:MAG: hypothetical protein BWY69_00430 [Planctomycetes bacterium ADurb.Bin401]|nr:MAG: hypothetical protein BWY69_00430 [Planctomycetes bacterium ADurb.Bin401]
MSLKRLQCGRLILLLLSTVFAVCSFGAPFNGNFELYDYNESTYRNDPNGWYTENEVTVVQNVNPLPSQGSKENWIINLNTGLFPFKGESCLLLSSGDSDLDYGLASQNISIEEGDKLTGAYFFGACDYNPFIDWAGIKLVPIADSNLEEIVVVYEDIQLIGTYGSFGGWKTFNRFFTADEVGDYNLVITVNDYQDNYLETYLAVDSIMLCKQQDETVPPEKGDFNCDCKVNFEDYTIYANDWMYDCNNAIMYEIFYEYPYRTSYVYDPNCNCLLGTDITLDGPVDVCDLKVFSENWLEGIKEEE